GELLRAGGILLRHVVEGQGTAGDAVDHLELVLGGGVDLADQDVHLVDPGDDAGQDEIDLTGDGGSLVRTPGRLLDHLGGAFRCFRTAPGEVPDLVGDHGEALAG